jgi:DNA processing protein
MRALFDRYGSATEVIKHHGDMITNAAMEHARQELQFIDKHHISTYFYKDDNYPYRLANCVDAPLVLYSKGNVNMNAKHMVSVVGTRHPSERGKDWCRRLVLDLANQLPDLTIVSGLAYGIDVVAHRAAIEAGIPTIIVPAHGLDRIYPAVHRNVAVKALEQGGIVTEYTCGTEPERFNFVARNRIVAGLADALVVVESKNKGGSLITADMAIDYGRDVFALPGRFDDECSAGCNDLIKHHKAQMIESASDLISCMQWQCQTNPDTQTLLPTMLADLSLQQQGLYQLLQQAEDGIHINQLVIESQLAYHIVASELVMMELQDLVKSMPGGMWRVKK